ncbi:hypothetical protein GTO89_15130 [Heliobacterium gestii]|uniref:Uncharacterized protein n=1 Tax=Heliomicrobium gestii TaxID=2699 RepID=A0A845LIZ1_HELGE|nr:hypothetical protein [Heliomicrobium gestii]MBM7868107.1 transcriptional regulator CtsR [Heliomicrobium gestii]MZP44365.1 hypothetical protein [Heliomicrobium gestii]
MTSTEFLNKLIQNMRERIAKTGDQDLVKDLDELDLITKALVDNLSRQIEREQRALQKRLEMEEVSQEYMLKVFADFIKANGLSDEFAHYTEVWLDLNEETQLRH